MAVRAVMAVRLVALLSTVPMAVVSQWLNHGYEWEHDDLNCFDQACHWQCNSWSNESKNTSWCHVFYRGLRRNNFYSPWIENTGRLGRLGRLHFTYKGNLELFSLVNNKWIKIWSDTRDTASKVEAVLPEASAQLRFESATWGAVGPITVERRRFRNLKTAVSASLWSQVHFTHGPSTRRWHTAVLDAGKMWIFAGDDGELKNDLWYYDTVSMDGWVDVSESGQSGLWPSPRFSHMAAMQGRYMWVFGGVVQSGLSKELWNYNMDNGNWSFWSLPGPTARESMTLVDLENRLWMFGGYDGSIRNDLWYLTTGSDPFWTLITSSGPSGRYSHDAFQSAGKLWIFGGLTQEGLKNDLWYFDISSNTWSQILEGNENGPSARESATAVVFKGSMWLFGGIDAKNQSDEVWKLDLLDLQSENAKSDAWRLLDSGTGPNGRRFHVSVLDEEGRMWCHNGELWYFETRTSTTTTTQSSTRTSTSQTTTETTSTSTSSTSSTSSSSSTTGTTTITSTSTTISSTTSTSSSSTTSTTKSTTSSSTSTRTSTTSSTSSSSTSSTTSISTTTSQTSTSSSSSSSTSTTSTSSTSTTTTTSSSSTSGTTTTSSSTSSSTSKTTTTSSTSRTSTSSTTISQTSTTSLTSTTSNTSTTTTETTTSSSTSTETTTSSSITWTSTTSSFTETTLTFWNTITSSTTTQVKDLNLLLHEFLKTQVEETLMNLTTSNASTVTVEIKSPDVDFHLSLVTFSNPGNPGNHTHPTDPTLVNESSTLLAVPSFTSPVASPLLASMSLSTLHLPGVDLPEIDAPVESANGKVGVVAGPLIQISLLDTELDSVDLNFSEPLIFRVSEEAVDSASCNFLTEAGWSEEGMHKASSEEVQQAFGPGPVDTSGTWCATTHLSLFTILRPCTFSETLQRESKCFDPPTFGALLGSSILCLCCGACGFYTTVRSRHVIGGKMKLSDVEGSSHDVPFQVKRPQRDNDFHGVLDGKTLVTWEVKPLAGRGSDGIRPVQMSDMATQLTSPKRRLHLNVVTKFFSDRADRSQVELPRSGTALSSLQSYPELEEGMEGGMEGPHDFHDRTARSTSSSGPVCEVFEDRQYIEYFSETHQKWIQGSIQGSGHLPTASSDEKIMPTYHVRLSRNQWRRFVPVNSLRLPFQPGDSVSVNVDDQWQAATVQKRHGYPLAYEVQLLHTFETHVLSGERVRSRCDKEDTILAFEGATKGWMQCSVESASESTWPQIMVAGLTLQGTDEALPIPHFLIRPSTRMEGFSS